MLYDEKWGCRHQVFLDAAQEIEKSGFCKGRGVGDDGSVCALQALFLVSPSDTIYQEACSKLERLTGINFVPHWNDAPERTKEDVINAFRVLAYMDE